VEPLRPSDYDDGQGKPAIAQPSLTTSGWARFLWRQLTSMKTALVLLLLLALGAIPGSLVPQRSADPNGVIRYQREDPELYAILDGLQLFDTYTSVWFSAIYLMLFISLIGCILPRTNHHLKALRQAPPATPSRLDRLEHYRAGEYSGTREELLASASAVLKKSGYRIAPEASAVAAERGYLRETANLAFHFALVGVLVALAAGTGFKYSGQRIIIEGQAFTNQLTSYDSFSPGRFFSEGSLEPYSLTLNEFIPEYEFDVTSGVANALDFTALMSVNEGANQREATLKVNQPLDIAGTSVYLLGNGFAPWVTVRSANGTVIFSQPVPFLPQDGNLTSVGVVKLPDGLASQTGLLGFLYPSAIALPSGALSSVYPEPDQPVLTFNVFEGDLGLNEGIPRNVYSLDTDSLTQITGGDTGEDSLVLGLGQSQELPGGRGSVEFTALPRFISVDIHRDPTQLPVGIASAVILGGLVVSLFVTRRRAWIRVSEPAPGEMARVEFAALARGDDPGLDTALERLVADFSQHRDSKLDAS
jgi:cytochrome c biogenesis protein